MSHTEVAAVDSDPHRLAAFGILDILKRYGKLLTYIRKLGTDFAMWVFTFNKSCLLCRLVDAGSVDLNAKDDRGCTPLIWACRNGQEVTQYDL